MQQEKYFPSISHFVYFLKTTAKYKKGVKYVPILHEATYDNYFTFKCLLKSNIARVILSSLLNITLQELTLLYSNIPQLSISIFQFKYFVHCFICFVFNCLLQLIYFRTFCSKHSITFKNTYLLSCWFHCVDIFYNKFRLCETLKVINSVTRFSLIETLCKFSTIKCWFIHIYRYRML